MYASIVMLEIVELGRKRSSEGDPFARFRLNLPRLLNGRSAQPPFFRQEPICLEFGVRAIQTRQGLE